MRADAYARSGALLSCMLLGGLTPLSALVPPSFSVWTEANSLSGAEAGVLADPDADGACNLEEFAFASDPQSGISAASTRCTIEGGYFIHTFPVREDAQFSPQSDTPDALTAVVDGIRYNVSGSTGLVDPVLAGRVVEEVSADDADLPALPEGWSYRSFRLQESVGEFRAGYLGLNLEMVPTGELGYTAVTAVSRLDESWWSARHTYKLGEVEAHDPQILLIGDSITHNWESLGSAVWADTFGDYPTSNLGFSGDCTENVLWRLRSGELPATLAPDLVILLIGTNNTGMRMDPAYETAVGIRAILDECQAVLPPATQYLLLGILPRGNSESQSLEWQRNNEVNALIAGCADEDPSVTYLDVGPVFVNDAGTMRTELMVDLYVHPNAAGYAAWAAAMEDTVRALAGPADWAP